jgi:acyl carrier protein
MDQQVKIRGYRIELGEIEATLAQHPSVKEAIVLARQEVENPKSESENSKSAIPNSQFSGKRLVAYVVNRDPIQLCDLREFLKAKLPDYMVPSSFVFLDALPLMPNGKVDRSALPAPDQSRSELEQGFLPPRTPVEELLAGIWATVLGKDQVGVYDNFFALGGHSLLATQVVSRIRKAFQADLPLRVLFEKPTVASLSDYVEAVRWVEKDRSQTHGSNLGETTEDILL